MAEELQDLPVTMILIVDNRVIVDGKNVGHDGTLPLSWVAIDAVVARVARPLGRPVHAVATDAAGTSTLVIHLDGALSDVQPAGEGQSEHFPPKAVEPVVPLVTTLAPSSDPPFSAPRLLGAAAVVTLVVGLLGAVAQNSASTTPLRSVTAPSSITTTSPTPDPSPVSSQLADSPEVVPVPKIRGIARHTRGGPVRLSIRSSVAPLKVRITLFPVGDQPLDGAVRQIRIGAAGPGGQSLVVFEDMPPQVYRWRITASGAEPSTGTIRVLGAPEVTAPEPQQDTVITPRSEPEPASSTPRPPRGPRENTPVPPAPQP